jgi:DNA-binding GntR family transcriptional regulator
MSEAAPDILGPVQALKERPSVERRVTATMRELIVSGQLPEETPLRHRDLADRLGVSPTPVRAVLGELQREGLVEIGPTGRAVVSRLTREDLEEVYALRLGLEGLAARLGAAAVGPRELERMEDLFTELRRHARNRATYDYLVARWAFHEVCYSATGRRRLVREVERLFWRAERYNRLVLSSAVRFRKSLAHYREFLIACERNDGPGAEVVIHSSVRWAVGLLWKKLPSEQGLPPVSRVQRNPAGRSGRRVGA